LHRCTASALGTCHNRCLSVDPDQRPTWSAELGALLERHPRTTWSAQTSPTVQFWLDVHDEFRRECVALTMAGDSARDARLTARDLAALAAPRLRAMVAHLHGHHEIEDHHYFPTFREAQPRLAPGFDLLANDHVRLDADIEAAVAALAALVTAAGAPGADAAARHATERYVGESDRLFRRLVRHLGDEEDLIIPLLLERGV
jgi:hypothetical protein